MSLSNNPNQSSNLLFSDLQILNASSLRGKGLLPAFDLETALRSCPPMKISTLWEWRPLMESADWNKALQAYAWMRACPGNDPEFLAFACTRLAEAYTGENPLLIKAALYLDGLCHLESSSQLPQIKGGTNQKRLPKGHILESVSPVDMWDYVGNALYHLKKFPAARDAFATGLHIRQGNPAELPINIFVTGSYYAMSIEQIGNKILAQTFYERLGDFAQRSGPLDPFRIAEIYYMRGRNHQEAGLWDDAIAAYQKTISLLENLKPTQTKARVIALNLDTLFARYKVERRAGQLQEARESMEQYIGMAQKYGLNDSLAVLSAERNIAELQVGLGNRESAEDLQRKLLAKMRNQRAQILSQAPGLDNLIVEVALDLVSGYLATCRLAEAEQYLDEIEPLCLKQNPWLQTIFYDHRSTLSLRRVELLPAKQDTETAVRISQSLESTPDTDAYKLDLKLRLAHVYTLVTPPEFEKSSQLQNEVETELRTLAPHHRPALDARLRFQKGIIQLVQGNPTNAKQTLHEAYDSYVTLLDSDELTAVPVMLQLAFIYYGQRDFDESRRLFETVLEAYKNAGFDLHEDMRSALVHLSEIARVTGDDSARVGYEVAAEEMGRRLSELA